MTTENKSDDVRKRIEQITTRNFTISACPEVVFRRFSDYAKAHTSDAYWMAIKELLDIAEANAKELVLYEKVNQLQMRIDQLGESTEKKSSGKTFGMKRGEQNE